MSRIIGIVDRKLVAFGASFLFILVLGGVASATQLTCGQTLTSSVKLETDLTCTGFGFQVAADNVTIDLGGHTMTGTGGAAAVRILMGTTVKKVRVKNGTIIGFNFGINLRSANGAVIDHVLLRRPGNIGIRIQDCSDVAIRNAVVEDPVASHGILVINSTKVTLKTVSVMSKNPPPPTSDPSGILFQSVSDAKVTNGNVFGFRRGITFGPANRAVVDNVAIREPLEVAISVEGGSSDIGIRNTAVETLGSGGIWAGFSNNVVLETVSLRDPGGLPPEVFTYGIFLDTVTGAEVKNVRADGYLVGMQAECWSCAPGELRGNGKVTDSVFSNGSAGIVLNSVTEYTVSGNHIRAMRDPNGWGYGIGGGWSQPIGNLRIEKNSVVDSDQGITFSGLVNSTLEGNKTLNNSGVGLAYSYGCTGNKSETNIALGNGVDLYSEIGNSNNVWEDNVCQTTYGDGVECDPSVAAVLQLGVSYLQYRSNEGGLGNRYQSWVSLTRDALPAQPSDVEEIRLFDPQGMLMNATTPSFSSGAFLLLDCRVDPCSQTGPNPDSGFAGIYPYLEAGVYRLEVDTSGGQTLTDQIVYPGQVVLPVVASASLEAQWVGSDLTMSWMNPTSDPQWAKVDQLSVVLLDGHNTQVLQVRLPPTATHTTVSGTPLSQAAQLGDGRVASWQVQTRAYDANSMNYARGNSNRKPLPQPAP